MGVGQSERARYEANKAVLHICFVAEGRVILCTPATFDRMTRERALDESVRGLVSYWTSVGIWWIRSDPDVACALYPTLAARLEIALPDYLEVAVDDTVDQMENWTHLLAGGIHSLIGREGPLPHHWRLLVRRRNFDIA